MGRRPRLAIPRDRLVQLYTKEHRTIEEIARLLGVSYFGVWKALERTGISRRKKQPKLANMTKSELEAALLAVYRAKSGPHTVAGLAAKLGVSRQHLTRVLKERGVRPWKLRRRATGGGIAAR